jgi:hypothetical protein
MSPPSNSQRAVQAPECSAFSVFKAQRFSARWTSAKNNLLLVKEAYCATSKEPSRLSPTRESLLIHQVSKVRNQRNSLYSCILKKDSFPETSLLTSYESELFPCLNILDNVEQTRIAATHKKVTAPAQQIPEQTYFSMAKLFTMAVGLIDGRMVLYDLVDSKKSHQAFHLAYPPRKPAPLTHLSFLEPSDDSKCAVYVWAFHSSPEGALAVMHSLMFATKNEGIYEEFKSCCSRLTMPMFIKDTFPICCRSIKTTKTCSRSTFSLGPTCRRIYNYVR